MSRKRPKGSTIEKPFVYGTVAIPIGKKSTPEEPNQKSHEWTVYVRFAFFTFLLEFKILIHFDVLIFYSGLDNEDLSYYIKRVVFHLHASFENPNRSKFSCSFVFSQIFDSGVSCGKRSVRSH